ncbi:hypothetical protein JCM10450v2_007813 [Rhodotorula kratochvilovae]
MAPPPPASAPHAAAAPAPGGAAQPPWARHLLSLDNPHPSPLSGTDDLLSLFRLEPVYDTFLRPYLPVSAALPPAPSLLPDLAPATAPKPAPASPSPAPGPPGGLKITLGGIKFGGAGGSGASAGGESADGPAGGGGAGGEKKRKRPRMEKTYEHMVGDVLGRISHPRTTTTTAAHSSLLHLISNPDPTPCPPLHTLDAPQLREAFTLRPGQLAGFDMSLWEARPGGAGAGGERKKKKKRKHDDASGGGGGGGGGEAKKQRR